MDQLVESHKNRLDSLSAEHSAILESKVKTLEKTISNQALELKATQDDLAKAKAAIVASNNDRDLWKRKAEDAERALAASSESSASAHAEELQRLTRELSVKHDDMSALTEVIEAQKNSMSEMHNNHTKELEEAAKSRADEVLRLRAEHDEEKSALVNDRNALTVRVSDLEGELATLRATIATQSSLAPSKSNGHASSSSPSVSQEDLKKLHEAHNLKLGDLEAEHHKAVLGLRKSLDSASEEMNGLRQDVEHRQLEINFLEQESAEKDDTITRYVKSLNKLILSRFPLPNFICRMFHVDRELPV